jgi:hypothetical protein
MRENQCLANVRLFSVMAKPEYELTYLVFFRRKANKLIPMNNHGIKTMSIGYLLRVFLGQETQT